MKEKIITLDYKNKKIKIACIFSKGRDGSVFFIHGMGCSKEFFKDALECNELRGYSILALDLMGFGNSSRPKGMRYTAEEHAEVCSLLVKKLKLKNISLVGHSFGGAISLLLISKMPSKISSFVNMEGNLIAEDCTMSREVTGYSPKDFRNYGFKKIVDEIKKQKDLLKNKKAAQIWQGSMKNAAVLALYNSSVSLVKWSESGKLLKMFKELKIKKCYMYGSLNKNLAVLKHLGGIAKFSISKSGHFMMIDNPKEFCQKLAGFINNKQT